MTFEKSEYAGRRQKFMEQIDGGIAILWGGHLPAGFSIYYQNNDFMYFTGVDIPSAILVMDARQQESTLFFTMGLQAARNEGIPPGMVTDTLTVTGLEHIRPYEEFSSYITALSRQVRVFYTPFMPQELGREEANAKLNLLRKEMVMNPWDGRLTREEQFVKLLSKRFPQVQVKDCSPHIASLRIIKSAAELAQIRKASQIRVRALLETIRSTRPGMYEYEVAAIYEYYCKKAGAKDLAYNTIISSAENHPYLHYYKHDRLLQDGDFLVIDAGPNVDYYATDMTVSYPANGIFTSRQREFYTACMEIQEACKQFLKPGMTALTIGTSARQYLKEKGFDTNQKDFKSLDRSLTNGAITHYVGMAVHDAGGGPGPDEPFRPGMVIALDVYSGVIEENTGVRVEDTIVITEEGYENLTPGLPRSIADIEALMTHSSVYLPLLPPF